MKKIFIISFVMAFIFIGVFFFIPDSQNLLSFSGIKFLAGEFYRLITFSFVHVTVAHLLENLMALALVSFLGYEFGLKGSEFLMYFIAVSFVIALGNVFLSPLLVIAGASLGIYGVLGALSMKGSNFISKKILIPVFVVSIFYKIILNFFTYQQVVNLDQTLFHLSGFFAGLVFFILPRFKKKRHILLRKNE